MKINFKELEIKDIENNVQKVDASKVVGNLLFNMADDVAEHDLGLKVYHSEGELELSEQEAGIVTKYLGQFKYLLRSAIEERLKS